MDILNQMQIISLPGAQNAQQNQGAGAPAEGLLAFLQTLGDVNIDKSITEKIAAILKDTGATPQAKLEQLRKILPGIDAAMAQKLLPASTAALTSDLTAKLAAGLQGEQQVLDQLAARFNELGPAPDDETIAAFKDDAVDYLRKMGCDDATIQKYMVSLASLLGDKITLAQSAEMAMPLPGQKPAVNFAAVEPAAGGTLAATPQEFALQQLSQAAKTPAKPALPQDSAQKPLPAPIDIKDTQKQSAPPVPQGKAQAANPALINIMADENSGGGFNPNGFGQQAQAGYGAALMRGPEALQPQNFVNYMPAANNTATTQMVALQIQRNYAAKAETFTMQLDPMNLGRLEIKMKFTRDGAMKAHLIAEKPETLSMLQKDAPQLQRILQQAGLDVDDGALSFDLRQQSQDHQGAKESYNGAGNSHGAPAAAGVETAAVKIAVEAMGYISQGGVNIVV